MKQMSQKEMYWMLERVNKKEEYEFTYSYFSHLGQSSIKWVSNISTLITRSSVKDKILNKRKVPENCAHIVTTNAPRESYRLRPKLTFHKISPLVPLSLWSSSGLSTLPCLLCPPPSLKHTARCTTSSEPLFMVLGLATRSATSSEVLFMVLVLTTRGTLAPPVTETDNIKSDYC